jgi:hypothetical protein
MRVALSVASFGTNFESRKDMRLALFLGLVMWLVALSGNDLYSAPQAPKDAPKDAPKATVRDTTAAAFTRTKLLKVKVTGTFKEERVGDILKEFAHLVDTTADQPVMWSYGADFPFSKKISFSVKDKPLDVVLDQLLTKLGGDAGYYVVSKDGDKYDGWVRLTVTGERGYEPPPPTAEEEATAAERLVLAKKLIDAGKPAAAKPVLDILVKKYSATKAGIEAKELLGKMPKE